MISSRFITQNWSSKTTKTTTTSATSTTIANKYHIYDEWEKYYKKAYRHSIGAGCFGKVWLVRSITTGKYFTMKEIDLKQNILRSSSINRAYALDEGLKCLYLNVSHENILNYYHAFINNEKIYWIMEYCDGGTLKERIKLYLERKMHMNEELIWYWSLQILKGLKYIHAKGIIHRDLKPDNIYIDSKRGTCKIGDFGFAKIIADASLCTQNTTIQISKLDCNEDIDEMLKKRKKMIECEEEPIVYKLINMSQVGTPAYMCPESIISSICFQFKL
jgi:serine/threonine protein kinase